MRSTSPWFCRTLLVALASVLFATTSSADEIPKVKVSWSGKGDIRKIMSGDHAIRRIGVLTFSAQVNLEEKEISSESATFGDVTFTTKTTSTVSLSPEGVQAFTDLWYERWVDAFTATGQFEVVSIDDVQKAPTFPKKGKELPTAQFKRGAMTDKWVVTPHGTRHFGSAFGAIGIASDDSYLSAVGQEAGCDAFLWIRPTLMISRKGGGPVDGVKGQWLEVQPVMEVSLFIPHDRYAAASKAAGSKIPPFMKMNPSVPLATPIKAFKVMLPFALADQKKGVTEAQVRTVLNDHFVVPLSEMQGVWPTAVAKALAEELH